MVPVVSWIFGEREGKGRRGRVIGRVEVQEIGFLDWVWCVQNRRGWGVWEEETL